MAIVEGTTSSSGNGKGNEKDDDNDNDDKMRNNNLDMEASTSANATQKTSKKKKGSDKNSDNECDQEQHDYEDKKRRNSFTDSPLTELSPSSAASNGDSADDIGSDRMEGSCKHDEIVGTESSTNTLDVYTLLNSNAIKREANQKRLADDFCLGFNEAETIDTMELEYAHEIESGIKKQLIKRFKYNKWTDAMYRTIFTGDFPGFHRRFKLVMLSLAKQKPQHFGRMKSEELAAYVAQGIVERFYDGGEKVSILMVLLANHDKDANCADRGHGHCRIAHMLMRLLPVENVVRLCEIVAERSGKTALHMAVATGNQCQLRLLLTFFCSNPNVVDKSGRAPIHYAVERNNLAMVKMLMWYGADVSMVQSWNSKYDSLFISMHANPSGTVNHWLQERLKALSHKMMEFASKLTKKCLKITKELSTIHFIRLSPSNWPSKIECQLNLHQKNLIGPSSSTKSSQHQPKTRTRSILFLIPIAFQTIDELSAASDPKIIRTSFPNDFFVAGQPILDRCNDVAIKLPHVFKPNHNSSFYAFELLPSSEALHRLNLRIGSWQQAGASSSSGDPRENLIIAAQAFQCVENANRTMMKSKTD